MAGSIAVVQPIQDYKPGLLDADTTALLGQQIRGSFNKHPAYFEMLQINGQTRFRIQSVTHPTSVSITIDPSSFQKLCSQSMHPVMEQAWHQYQSANGSSEQVATDALFRMLDAADCPRVPGGNAYNFALNALALSRAVSQRQRNDMKIVLPNDLSTLDHFQQFTTRIARIAVETRLRTRRSLHLPTDSQNAMLSTAGMTRQELCEFVQSHATNDRSRVIAAAYPMTRPGALVLPSSVAMKELSAADVRAHQCMLNDEEFRTVLKNSALPTPRVLQQGNEQLLRDFDTLAAEDASELQELMVQLFDHAESRRARPAPASDDAYERLLSVGVGPAGCVSVYRTTDGLHLTFARSLTKDDMRKVLFLLSSANAGHFNTSDLTGRGDACAAMQYVCDTHDFLPSEYSLPRFRRLLKMWCADTLGRVAPALVAQTQESNLSRLDDESVRNIFNAPCSALRNMGTQLSPHNLPALLGIQFHHRKISDDCRA